MDLAANLEIIQRRLHDACQRSHRSPAEVRLMAVTKNHPVSTIRALADLGVRLFGENRVQEARPKISEAPAHLEWHLIGHLQTNKAREAAQTFHCIQSVDSLRLALELQRRADALRRSLPILIEVNVAGESTKFGYSPEAFLSELQELNALPRLEIHGLMCMAPYSPVPERARPTFRRCRDLARRAEDLLGAPLPVLSMGMSGDFEVAVEEGSTLVRIGTALVGERPRTVTRHVPED